MHFARNVLRVLGCLLTAQAIAAGSSGPTHLVVPYGPGGSTDIAARILAAKLGDLWNVPVIVENRPGAAGTIASRHVANSAADGKTLILVTSSHAINTLLYTQLPYDTLRDFTPIAQVATVPNVLLTGSNSGYQTLKETLDAGRKDPDMLSFGDAGAGSPVHLAGEMLSASTGVKVVPVHYKSDSESIAALVGGHIPLSFNTVSGAQSQIDAGTVRVLAVTGADRVPSLSGAPTMQEAGVPGYAVANGCGVVGPAKVDPGLVQKLNADLSRVLADPELKK